MIDPLDYREDDGQLYGPRWFSAAIAIDDAWLAAFGDMVIMASFLESQVESITSLMIGGEAPHLVTRGNSIGSNLQLARRFADKRYDDRSWHDEVIDRITEAAQLWRQRSDLVHATIAGDLGDPVKNGLILKRGKPAAEIPISHAALVNLRDEIDAWLNLVRGLPKRILFGADGIEPQPS